MKAVDKAPVNGYTLKFRRVGSYSYPVITRASDEAIVWSGTNRPYQGRKTDAYAKFRETAGRCVSVDGVKSRDDLNDEQIASITILSNMFQPAGRGVWTLTNGGEND